METVKGKPIFKHQGYSLDCREGHMKKRLSVCLCPDQKNIPNKIKARAQLSKVR